MRILVADDDSNDAFLIQRAFAKAGVTSPLRIVKDGQEALDYLEGKGTFATRDRQELPNTLILDVKMPRLNGFDVLTWVKSSDAFRRLPVIMFSSSGELRDVNRAYDLGANSYLVKPGTAEELLRIVKDFVHYWTQISHAPEPAVAPGSGLAE
jgi:CheY-like chemotaxis protein